MERKSFIKSLLTLAAAPKLIAELNIPMKAAPLTVSSITPLFSQLHFVVPDYLPKMIEKYGNTDWVWYDRPTTVWELKEGAIQVRNVKPEEMYEHED